MNNKNEQEIVELWKKLGVSKCEASFMCGGDSMNEMSFTYFDKESEEIPEAKSELDDYFDDVIYDKVDFYVNSDGHYMGENGVVHIELFEDDENDLLYKFLRNGIYRPSKVKFSISPSMDIQVASNFERLISSYYNNNSKKISALMKQLSSKGFYKIDKNTLRKIQNIFYSKSINADNTKKTIK